MFDKRKAMLLIIAGLLVIISGCAPARERQRQIESLKNQLEGAKRSLSSTEQELQNKREQLERQQSQLKEERDEAEELRKLSERLQLAKEEREQNLREMEELVKDISGMSIEPRAEGDFIVIENEILFDPGQIELKQDAKNAILDTVVPYIEDQLARNEDQLIRIDGHTDGQPITYSQWNDNYHLSVMRAHAVMQFLAEQGISSQNLFLAGFGPNQPIVEPPSPRAAVEENRRVEILLVPLADDDIQKILEDFVR